MKKTYILIALMIVNFGMSQDPNDCQFALKVCSDATLNLDASGIGVQELSNSNTCSSQENNSIWFLLEIVSPGTLGFVLTPNSTDLIEDYDFFIYGPNVECGAIGQAIRCSTTNPLAANLTDNLTGMNATETDVSEGPGALGNSFIREMDVLAGETYYLVIDRPIGNSPFTLEWTGTAEFPSSPVNPIEDMNVTTCDNLPPFDDGIVAIDFTERSSIISGTNPNIVVSYHTSENDALINTNAIGNTFNTTAANNTYFVRIEDITNNCPTIESFEINITSFTNFNAPEIYTNCAESIDSLGNFGIATFDLTESTQQIIGSNTNFNVTYYTSEANALSATNPLPTTFTNTQQTPLTLFVRVEDNLTNCAGFTELILNVEDTPLSVNTTLLQCDDDGINEGFTTFNLNEAIDAITNSANNVTVSFFETIADAENNTNALNTNVYQNFINPDVIYARVTSTITGCFSTAEITLQASVTSTFNTTLSQCDDDGLQDGFYTFNLNDAADTVLANSPAGLTISYYDTYTDALLETNAISNTYTNTTPYQQTVFARVENGNACYGISQIQLNVFQQPQLNENQNTTYCLNSFPETIGLSAQILNNTSNAFSYLWSTGATTSAIQVNAAGVYNVTVTNSLGCSSVQSFTVTASNIATIENINITDAVDANSISVIVSGEGLYEFALNAPNGPYQSSHTFTNVLPGFYTVYIRDVNNCGITNQDVAVIGFPKFFTPNGDGVNEFWNVRGINAVFQPNTTVLIFDKQGKLLIELDPLGSGWNGTINGQKMPSSDYWFKVTLKDGRVYTDHFALKR